MANTGEKASGRLHKATYATDNRKPGGYLIRVSGPTADKFSGREVPVTRKDGSESTETLLKCIWSDYDPETGEPVALYRFEAKPRNEQLQPDLPF